LLEIVDQGLAAGPGSLRLGQPEVWWSRATLDVNAGEFMPE